MNKIEVSLKITGNQDKITNELIEKGFSILWKVKTIDKYYIKNDHIVFDIDDFKNNYVRLRQTKSLIDQKINYYFDDPFSLTIFDTPVLKENNINDFEIKLEETFKRLFTTVKIDFVLKKDDYIFQIQDIESCGLIVSYDNEKYINYNSEEQRQLLIKDLEEFGFNIKDYNDFNKFKELLTINKILK